jgi:hypothetical protein
MELPDIFIDILYKNLANHLEPMKLIVNDVNKVINENYTLFERR